MSNTVTNKSSRGTRTKGRTRRRKGVEEEKALWQGQQPFEGSRVINQSEHLGRSLG